VLEMGRRHLEEVLRREDVITSPQATRQYLASRLREYGHEVFACLFLDNQHRVLVYEELFTGTIDGASVYPREVVKRALNVNCAAVIFAHSHRFYMKALPAVACGDSESTAYSQIYSRPRSGFVPTP